MAWGPYAAAVARWERLTGVPAPPPTDEGGRLSPTFVEWMVGLPLGWTDVPQLPQVRNPARHTPDQLPHISRTARLKGLGNIGMPAQAHRAWSALLTAHDR